MALFGGKKDKEKEPEESKQSFDFSSDRGRLDYFNVASRPVKDAFIKRHPALGKDDLYKHAMFNYAQEDVTGKFSLDLTGYTSKESIDSLIGRINTQMESSRINLETTDLKSPAFEKELRSFMFIGNSEAAKKTEAIIGTSMSNLYESIKEMELDGTKPSELEGKLKDHSLTDLNKTFYSTILHALTEKGFDRKDLDMQKTLLETKVETIFEKAPAESAEKKQQETTPETKPAETPIAKVNEVKPVEAPAPASTPNQEAPAVVNEVKPVAEVKPEVKPETPAAPASPASATPAAEINKTEVTPPKQEAAVATPAEAAVATPASISTPAQVEPPTPASPPMESTPTTVNSVGTSESTGSREDKQMGETANFLKDLGIPIETLNAIGFTSSAPAEAGGKSENTLPGGSGVKEAMKNVAAQSPQIKKTETPVVQSVAPEITKEITPIAVAETKQEQPKAPESPAAESNIESVSETPIATESTGTPEAPPKPAEAKADNASGSDMSEVAALLKKLIKVMEGPLLVTDTKNKY
jgi:hypothetical protein